MNQKENPSTIGAAVTAALRDPRLASGAGVSVGLFLTIAFLPILGAVLGSFTPVPLIYHYYVRGRIFGLTMIGLAASLVTLIYFLAGHPFGGLVFMEYSLLAVAVAEGLNFRLKPEKLIGYSVGLVLGVAAFFFVSGSLLQGQSPWPFLKTAIREQVRMPIEMYEAILSGNPPASLGEMEDRLEPPKDPPTADRTDRRDWTGDEETMPQPKPAGAGFSEQASKLSEVLIAIFPGLMIMGTILVVWANMMMVRLFLSRSSLLPPQLADLKGWRAPEVLVWMVIASGFGVFLPLGGIEILCINALLVLGLVYFLQGLCIISFWMEKKNAPSAIKALVYILVAIQQYLVLVIAALGLFDMWFDFRRLKTADKAPPV